MSEDPVPGPATSGGVLVLNVGSSSVRYALVDPDTGQVAVGGHVQDIGGDGPPGHDEALERVVHQLAADGADLGRFPPLAVGHRVVHGGPRFHDPVLVDDAVLADIEALEPLAPLHNRVNLAGIRAMRRALPEVPQVAVFDTAFHHTLPARASTYAVPRAWREEHHVRRYGFHGTSYAHVLRRATALLGTDPAQTNLVALHLGNGASACAIEGGRSIDTSMGLSPLEGLVMGTRSGDVDPSLGAYLDRVAGLGVQDYDDALNHASGLAGLAGVSDLREVEARRAAGDEAATLAFDVAAYRLRKYIGGYAVVLGRVDAIVFTGGIGEHSPELRGEVLGGLGLLGVELDAVANAAGQPERRVTGDSSRIPAYVVPANEELEIARAALSVVGVSGPV